MAFGTFRRLLSVLVLIRIIIVITMAVIAYFLKAKPCSKHSTHFNSIPTTHLLPHFTDKEAEAKARLHS